MVVEAKHIAQFVLLHGDETRAVGKGEIFVVVLLKQSPGVVPDGLCDMFNLKKGRR